MSFLREGELSEQTFAPFAALREKFGLIPNLFRAQGLRPDFIEAEVQLLSTVLLQGRRPLPAAEGVHRPGLFGGAPEHLLRDHSLRDDANDGCDRPGAGAGGGGSSLR